MRAASVAGYLSLALLALFLIRCGASEPPIAELTEADEETSASAASEDDPAPKPSAETTASTAAVAEAPAGEETPSQTARVAQQVADEAGDVDAKEAYGRALQALRPADCEPTQPDTLGPFYEPNAPERTSVGSGYVLSGAVLAAGSCEPIRDARIEFWLANLEGVYDDAHRATVPAGGEYRFESNVPVPYEDRPPHIHLRVTAPGYQELVTQHYPDAGQTEANFDLVLEPV
ncbi:MAG: hypothetical protein M3N18_02065 [Actinomycetota bacterium]|nr:hypothetical protein [Actinomycetota bacterium]